MGKKKRVGRPAVYPWNELKRDGWFIHRVKDKDEGRLKSSTIRRSANNQDLKVKISIRNDDESMYVYVKLVDFDL